MVLAPLAHVPGMGIFRNHEDLKRVFCSELVAAAYEYSGALPFGTDASDVAPADLCQMPLYGGVAQLKGTETDLPRVGVVDQNGNRIVSLARSRPNRYYRAKAGGAVRDCEISLAPGGFRGGRAVW